MNDDRGLIIFIKNPQAGRVKTRLAADLGDEAALKLYLELLSHTRNVAGKVMAQRYLFYDRFIEDDEWPSEDYIKAIQADGDLGHRIYHAFEKVMAQHQKAVIIGSDCPDISTSLIEKAFDLLENHDAVIGPAFDGGYYLLGFRNRIADVFSDMPWSTNEVFALTTKRFKEHGVSYATLRMLRDVDTIEDLE